MQKTPWEEIAKIAKIAKIAEYKFPYTSQNYLKKKQRWDRKQNRKNRKSRKRFETQFGKRVFKAA